MRYFVRLIAVLWMLAIPISAGAVGGTEETVFGMDDRMLTILGLIAFGTFVGCILAKFWLGICNHVLIDNEYISSIQNRRPYFPRSHMIIATIIATGALFIMSLKTLKDIVPFDGISNSKLLIGFFIAGLIAIGLQYKWRKSRDFVFAVLIGTGVSFGLMGLARVILITDARQDPFIMSLGIICVIILWKFLFGPWMPKVKATVLGTFILWIGIHVLFKEAPDERFAHLVATFIALIPALVWCWFFLEYHKQHKSIVLLMFFAGMLSTAPILFYDAVVRSGIEFQFFLFRIVPENFSRVSNAFVSGNIVTSSSVKSNIIAMLISFLIVGLIEETSKLWVLNKSGRSFFSSIDDVIQMAVIVAIGFAFAENVLNPSYFLAFVREYLTESSEPQWLVFLGNVSGRSILTTMVHIVSSGVIGYFLGLSIFAKSYLNDVHKKGETTFIADVFYWLFRLPPKRVFKIQVMVSGLIISSILHGMFNFMVTLPDMLPNNPETFGDLLKLGPNNILHYFPILLLPSFLYIVGGFWIFTMLFYRQESMKERGCPVTTDNFIKDKLIKA